MTPDFEEIRCYRDEEVHEVLSRLIEEKQFMKVLSTVYPLLPKEVIKQRLLSFHANYDFQTDKNRNSNENTIVISHTSN
jgi:hypothetical protein